MADNYIISKITWICVNFDPRITSLNKVIVYHGGYQLIVEVEVSLPPEMTLKEYKTISDGLRKRIQSLKIVQFAYITLSVNDAYISRMWYQ